MPRAGRLFVASLLAVMNGSSLFGWSEWCPEARFMDEKHKLAANCWFVPGQGDMLFSATNFYRGASPMYPSNLPVLRKFSDTLAARGIHLVLLPIPSKGLLYAERLAANQDPEIMAAVRWALGARDDYRIAVARLREAGIDTVDLLDPFLAHIHECPDELLFFKTDVHWTPRGADMAASLTADRIRAHLPSPTSLWETKKTGQQQFLGFTGKAVSNVCSTKWDPESVDAFATSRTDGADAGLFDEVASPIAVVGTSFTWRYNFMGFLRQHTGFDVYDGAIPGGAFYGALDNLLISEGYRETPPTVLVWEYVAGSNPNYPAFSNFMRQMTPAVQGDCVHPTFETKQQLDGRTARVVSLTSPLAVRETDYAVFRFDDRSLTKFDVKTALAGSAPDLVQVRRHSTVRNEGLFFVSMPPAGGELKTIDLIFRGALPKGEVSVRICNSGDKGMGGAR
ncbi:MAG TPA: hypothetical protein VEK57_14280 [Thermoanaerobaculia bacterium]|nr:hypothetical protein [Thermoanaerobaculia bacterium]